MGGFCYLPTEPAVPLVSSLCTKVSNWLLAVASYSTNRYKTQSSHLTLGKKVNKHISQNVKLCLHFNICLPDLSYPYCVCWFTCFIYLLLFHLLCTLLHFLLPHAPFLIYSLPYNLFPSCLSLFHISVAGGQGKVPH